MTSIIITLLLVFYKVPLINLLGDKGMGYYSIALVIYLFLMTCISYGLPKAVSSLLISQSSKGQYRLVYKTIISSFIYATIAGGISTVLLILGADTIASSFMSASYGGFTIRVFAPCLLFVSVLGVLHGIYTGIKRERISIIAHRIEVILVAVFSILGVYIFSSRGLNIAEEKSDLLYEPVYGSMGAALGLCCGVFITCVFVLICFGNYRKKLLRMSEKDVNSKVIPSKKEIIIILIKTMFPFALTVAMYHLSNLIDYSIFNHMMNVQGYKENNYIILLGMLNGKYEFFISMPLLFVQWYVVSKVPSLTQVAKEGSKRKVCNKIGQNIRYTMMCIIPFTVFYILYAKPLMNLLFNGINDTPAVLLKTGAISIVLYSLAMISNAALNTIEEGMSVARNVLIALVVHVICLLIMMIVLQWGIVAVVISRIVFASCIFILNDHTLRERTGYIQEYKRTFFIPLFASIIMGAISLVIYIILEIFLTEKIAVLIALVISVLIYVLSLIILGGITQREMYQLPGGKLLAPLCRKLHLIN